MTKMIFSFLMFLSMTGTLALIYSGSTQAAAISYSCPTPDQVNCIPAKSILGSWHANGGQMTGNTFAPNNQCANVIVLPNNNSRLMCCYTKCGVFFMDVSFTRCKKVSEARFICEN